jgi:predicted secreted protein
MIRIDESFDGRTIAIRVGEIVEIALAENASTGYRWDFSSVRERWASTLHVLEESAGVPDTRPGIPGTRRLVLEALVPGKAELEFEYRRPWQRSSPAARTFRVVIEVRNVG